MAHTTSTNERTTTSITLDLDSMTAAIDTHLEAYGTADATRRGRLVAGVWAADGLLVDPPIGGAAHDGIAALGDVIQAHYVNNATTASAHGPYVRTMH